MLGGSILGALASSGIHEVLAPVRDVMDLRSRASCESLLRREKPDLVIHAAAKVGGIKANLREPVAFLAENLTMDTNLILSALDLGINKLIYIGSSCMYPRNYRQPLVEDDILGGHLEASNEGFALAKIAASKLCTYASASLGVAYKTLVPSNLYGPGDTFDLESAHLLAAVVGKVHLAKMANAREVEVWGQGTARREFTYVGDIASWMVSHLDFIEGLPPILNLGVGVDYSINDFYTTAMKVMNYEVPLIHDPTKPEGMKAKLMDSSLAKAHHGWNPTTDLTQGIEKTYQWFLDRQETGARL
jgi:GDP-L-fucose synthase